MIQVAGGILLALLIILGLIVGFPVLVLFLFTYWYIFLIAIALFVLTVLAHVYEDWRYERAMKKWRESNS